MFGQKSPAVLVVGAGPVGLLAALSLVRQGARVDIIDEAEHIGDVDSRAPSDDVVVLSPSSLALLDQARITSELLDSSQRVSSLELYDREQLIAEVSFSRWAADLGLAFPFVAVASRIQLEALLRAALERHHVKVRSGWRLALMEQGAARTRVLLERLGRESTGYATLHTELVVEKSEELEPRFVIAAECRAVPIYRQLGIELRDLGKRTLYAVFDGKNPAPADRARLVRGEQIEAAFWPRRDDRLRCVLDLGNVASDDWFPPAREAIHAEASELVALSRFEGRLTTLLAERAPALAMRMTGLELRALFSTRPRLASEFGRGRIWLAGAAAHSAAPLAAQTSNGGLREAVELAKRCARALTRDDPSEALGDAHREAALDWEPLLAPPRPSAHMTPLHALLGRASAGLAASRTERDALFAQL